jgi:hypothetical protein
VERIIPQPAEVVSRLRLATEDARFLASALDRLPGDGELHGPVIVELNGKVAVRATAPDKLEEVTELVLSRSMYTGTPICICTNRAFLERALRLGFTEIDFTGVESPFVGRDPSRVYAVQPLSDGSAPDADAEVIRIESSAASGGASRVVTDTESTRRSMSERVARNGPDRVTPVETPTRVPARPAEVGAVSPEQPGTSLAALIQEAESLHATLADAKARNARLIAGLRRHRKQSRLVNETLKSLRELRLQDVVA